MPKKKDDEVILFISDLHAPYMHRDTVAFFYAVKKKYRPSRIVSVGDEIDCFPQDAEILTEKGWMTFRSVIDYPDIIKVAQWNESAEISFTEPLAYVDKPFDGNLLRIEHSTYLSMTTPKHAIVKIHPLSGSVHRREAWDSYGSDSWFIPRFGTSDGSGVGLSDDQLKLQVAFQADGTFDRGAAKWGFSKERKSERLREILKKLNLLGSEFKNTRGDTVLRILKKDVPDFLSKTFDPNWIGLLSAKQRKVILDELVLWDGTPTQGGFRYSCVMKENLDFVQALANSSGMYSSRVSSNYVTILYDRKEKTTQKSATRTEVSYHGKVCCVQVPTGMIIVRQEGISTVSGNCHAMSFHDSDPDLDSPGKELEKAIKCLKPLYKLFPEMDLVDSNHGSMVFRKAKHHGIPVTVIKPYRDVLEAPKGWKWHNTLTLKLNNGQDLFICHGMSANGQKLAESMGMNVIQGHYHSKFQIQYSSSPSQLIFSMQIGCSIDDKSLAFSYNKVTPARPIIGHGIVINGTPKLLPMLLNKKGRWTGVVP